jgi:antitoxin (DNA-binding transcriptional repressor) of toxin-antitoxin stability system
MCYTHPVARIINQRDLRNNSAEIMRALDRGETFLITRGGVMVGELRPVRRQLVSQLAVLKAFEKAPALEASRFRSELDEILDQDCTPHA